MRAVFDVRGMKGGAAVIVVCVVASGGGCASTRPTYAKAGMPPAGSAPATHAPQVALRGKDGIACVGDIAAAPAGATPVTDQAFLDSGRDVSGKGMLCAGQVYEATGPIKVYRVWQADRPY